MEKAIRVLLSAGAILGAVCMICVGLLIQKPGKEGGKGREEEITAKAKQTGGYVDDELYVWNTEPGRVRTDQETGYSYAEGEVLVSFEERISAEEAKKRAEAYHASLVGMIGSTGECQWYFGKDYSYAKLKELAQSIQQEEGVSYAVVNYITEMSVCQGAFEGVGLKDYSVTNDAKQKLIHAREAWETFEGALQEEEAQNPVNVGVWDLFFDEECEDLNFHTTFYNYTSSEELRQTIEAEQDENKKNSYKHGTHVAGIIGGIYRNGIGIDGMYPLAYDQKNQVSHLYALSHTWAASDMIHAKGMNTISLCEQMEVLFRNKVKVINYSMGYNEQIITRGISGDLSVQRDTGKWVGGYLEKRVKAGHDFLIVAAAGNEGNTDCKVSTFFANVSKDEFEEAYKRIIIVGSCNTKGKLSKFSCVGDRVDLLAPGENISSIVPGKDMPESMDGTSMAAPYVTGTAAMMWTLAPHCSGADIKGYLVGSADFSRMNSFHQKKSYGVLNAGAAVSVAVRERERSGGIVQETEEETVAPEVGMHRTAKEALESYMEKTCSNAKIMDTKVLKTKKTGEYTKEITWNADDLTGTLSYEIRDYDGDGQEELLVIRFETVPTVQYGQPYHETVLFLDMYEYQEDVDMVHLQTEKKIPVSIRFMEANMGGHQASCFTYEYQGQTYIVLDAHLTFNEEITTLGIYRYADTFEYVKGLGYQEQGEGDYIVWEALKEPKDEDILNCQNMNNTMDKKDDAWKQAAAYYVYEHDYASLSQQEAMSYYSLYRSKLNEIGLDAQDQRHVVNVTEKDAAVTAKDVYQCIHGAENLSYLACLQNQMLIGSDENLMIRRDDKNSLDAYRLDGSE